MPVVECAWCGADVYKRPRDIAASVTGRNYCSLGCSAAMRHALGSRRCMECENPLPPKSRRKTCGDDCLAQVRHRRNTRVPGSDARSSSSHLKAHLFAARGERCERCGYDNKHILVAHHVVERRHGGSNSIDNLELLCPNCHAEEHHARKVSELV